MYKPGRYKAERRRTGGSLLRFADARGLEEACPVTKIYGKGMPRSYEAKLKILTKAARQHRAVRQAQQADADACICTWQFELASLADRRPLPKRREMTEREAATHNREIRDLGLYWRRASY